MDGRWSASCFACASALILLFGETTRTEEMIFWSKLLRRGKERAIFVMADCAIDGLNVIGADR